MRKNVFVLACCILLIITSAGQLSAQESTQDIDESQLLLDDAADAPEDTPGDTREEEPAAEAAAEPIGNITFWDFLRMVLILGVIIGLIYLLFYFIKKRGSPKLQNNELFEVISTQVLSSNRTIHLVQVGNQFFLIGSGEQSVNLISEIKDRETIDEIRLKLSNVKSGDRRNFKNIFSGLFGQGSVRLDGSVNSNTDFLNRQRDKLKRM